MPVARRYGERQVATAALPSARRRASATPLSEGVGLAQAKGDVATALARTGETVANIGEGLYAQQQAIKAKARHDADDIAVMAAENSLMQWEQQRIHDPKSGALTLQGKAAFELPEAVDQEFDTKAGELEKTLGTPEQKQAFLRVRYARKQAVGLIVRRHTAEQIQAYDAAEAKTGIENHLNLAMQHAQDPELAQQELGAAVEIVQTAGRRNGLGPEAIQSQVAAVRSAAHVGIINNLVAAGQTKSARVYLAAAEKAGQISGAALDQVKNSVKQGTVDAEGERLAGEIWSTFAPAAGDDTTPISLDRLEDQARALAGDDQDVLKATRSALRSRKQAVDDGRKERLDGVNQTLWGAVLQGQTYAQIRTMPEAVSNPSALLRVRDYLDNAEAREESRAASKESRAAAAESRAYQREVRRENELEISGWARYQELTDPAKLRTLTRGAILAELPTLGRQNVNRLLGEWESRTKDDSTLRKSEIDADLFKEVATASGITYAYATPGSLKPSQKATLGRLQALVNDQVAARALAAARPLTPKEQREVMTEVLDRKVMLNDWGYDTELPAAIVSPDDKRKVYVPFDQVPDTVRTAYADYLRGRPPVSASEQRTRMERAYGLYLTGSTKAEIEAALTGGS